MIDPKDMRIKKSDIDLAKEIAKDLLGIDITENDAKVACYVAEKWTTNSQDWLDYIKQYFIN